MAQKKDEVAQKFERGREQAEDLMEEGVEKAERFFDGVGDEAARMWKKTGSNIKSKARDVDDYAGEHPWQMTAAGAAIGFLLAALIFRRRD